MPYTPYFHTVFVDLQALGATPTGEPFYAVVYTLRSLPREKLREILTTYPEVLDYLRYPDPVKLWDLYTSPAYKALAASMVCEWNIEDPETGERLAIPSDDPTVVNRVPRAVWDKIVIAGKHPTAAGPQASASLRVVRPFERR